MTLRKKLAVAIVFCTAFFVIISSIFSLVYCIWLTETTDTIWAVYPVAMWSTAELASITLAATFPTMPRLWSYIRTNERNSQHHGSSRGRSTPFLSYKPRQPINAESSPSAKDNVPLKREYKVLQDDKKKYDKEELELQILKTETYTIESRTKQTPDVA